MGQPLSEPITTKETSYCSNENFKVGASCMQGWRVHMEDAHTCFLNLPNDRDAAYFAVFDGHGGTKVAHYAGSNMHTKILNQPEYRDGQIEEAIRKGFLALDFEMLNDKSMCDELAGSTGIVCILKQGLIYCGNAGDSRAIASVSGQVQILSHDHKPSLTKERERIVAAGGWIDWNRVNGNLALSRALGDFVFKKNDKRTAEEQIVTANPDVIVEALSPDHEFIVLACDGIWDVLTNQEVITFVRSRIAAGVEPHHISEELMMRCLAPDCHNSGLGCDNMTVVIVCLLQGQDFNSLQQRCAKISSNGGPASDILFT